MFLVLDFMIIIHVCCAIGWVVDGGFCDQNMIVISGAGVGVGIRDRDWWVVSVVTRNFVVLVIVSVGVSNTVENDKRQSQGDKQ